MREWIAQTSKGDNGGIVGNVEKKGKVATFKEAAAHGELLINATHGQASVEALKLAGADKVGGKVLIDVANQLDFSKGAPPGALASQTNCLAETIQAFVTAAD